MSRRRAFDTNLSGSAGAKPKVQTKVKPAETITPPDPEHATLHVPTESDRLVTQTNADTTVTPPALDDSNLCFICAEPVTYWAVGQCNHRVCHVCAIRLRVFYKMIECAYCKTLCPSVLFSRSAETDFPDGPFRNPSNERAIEKARVEAEKPENKGKKWYQGLVLPGTLDLKQFPYCDEKLGLVFEDEEVMESSLLLLRYNCPYPDCAHMANGWQALDKHTLAEHGLTFCRICTGQLSRFSHEQVLYPPHLLALHDPSRLKRGQKPPQPRSAKERESVKGWDAPHPMCEFCHEAFFGPDELFKHMRDRHEECFVCRQLGEKDVYFQNYAKLENHFNRDHFPCQQPVCLEKKFQVFGSEMDLRAHMMSEHGEAMTQRDRAKARQLNIEFAARPDAQAGSSHAHTGGRGFSMGQDTPHGQRLSAAPPMIADQAAQHRRQKEIDQREESRRRRQFATELSESNGASGRPSAAASGRPSPEPSASGFSTPRDDVDDATAARHAALLSRVAMLVGDSPTKLASFRSAVRQFKNNESGAKDMIDTLFHVLDQDRDSASGIAREIANLFRSEGDQDKERAVLEAVNAFRIEQEEQFPALGGPPTGVGTDWAGVSSGRILSAKRATHTGRGNTNSRHVWDRVEAAAASHPVNRPTLGANGRHVPGAGAAARLAPASFPALGAASGSSARSAAHSTPWASGGAGSSSKAPSALVPQIRSVNYATGPTKAKPVSSAAFPSLPKASSSKAAERAALFSKPTPRQESIARIRGQSTAPSGSAWSASEAANGVADMGIDDPTPAETQAPQTGKKKGKQKQLLFSVSTRPS